jgi:hypothetical protein
VQAKVFTGVYHFNTGSCLCRKSFIDHQNPVAVTQELELLCEDFFPVGRVFSFADYLPEHCMIEEW